MTTPPTELQLQVDQLKAYMEDLGRIGGRQETARAFYLSVISALAVFLSLAGKDGVFLTIQTPVVVVVGLVGLVICGAWYTHMRSFGALFEAKLATMRKIENALPVQPFTEELKLLEGKQHEGGYVRFTEVDMLAPCAFMALFIAFIVIK